MPDTILEGIRFPKDIQSLDFPALEELAEEIRQQMIKTISQNGGHLASNLGTVELTIACTRCSIARPTRSSGTWGTKAIPISC